MSNFNFISFEYLRNICQAKLRKLVRGEGGGVIFMKLFPYYICNVTMYFTEVVFLRCYN